MDTPGVDCDKEAPWNYPNHKVSKNTAVLHFLQEYYTFIIENLTRKFAGNLSYPVHTLNNKWKREKDYKEKQLYYVFFENIIKKHFYKAEACAHFNIMVILNV